MITAFPPRMLRAPLSLFLCLWRPSKAASVLLVQASPSHIPTHQLDSVLYRSCWILGKEVPFSGGAMDILPFHPFPKDGSELIPKSRGIAWAFRAAGRQAPCMML